MTSTRPLILDVRRAVLLAGLSGFAAFAQANGALDVSREVEVDAAPATVWKMIGDFNHLDVWHPALTASTIKGNVRTLTLGGDGGTITEKQTAHSDPKMTYSYTILGGPLPVQHYDSTLAVRPGSAAGKSLVSWKGSFDAKGAPDDKAKEVIQGIYDAGLAKVVANFKK